MLDVLFLLEMAWCGTLMSMTTVRRSLMYSGGALAAGYVSWALTPWISHVFAPPMSPAMLWIQSQITPDVEKVMSILPFMPPEPVSAGGMVQSQWVAYHFVQVMCFILLTSAVFLLFMVVSYVTDAVWDIRIESNVTRHRVISLTLGLLCGAYVVVLSTYLIANLAWLKSLTPLSEQAGGSIIIHWIAVVVTKFGWMS